MKKIDDEVKAKFYRASLGFYKSFADMWPLKLQGMVNDFNAYVMSDAGLNYKNGEEGLPGILTVSLGWSSSSSSRTMLIFMFFVQKTIGQVGLRNVKGLNVVKELPETPQTITRKILPVSIGQAFS